MKTIVILGGGYAGINLIESLKKELKEELGSTVKIILIDKNAYHFRKVMLMKAITENRNALQLKIPFHHYFSKGIELEQGEVVSLNKTNKEVSLQTEGKQLKELSYDYLAITLGSRVKEQEAIVEGITLKDEESAHKIRNQLLALLNRTKVISKGNEQIIAPKIAVVGGGITGIETASELAIWLEEQAQANGIAPHTIDVLLFDPKQRLLPQAPKHISEKLEKKVKRLGVSFIPNTRVKEFENGRLTCEDGKSYEVGSCIFTNGVQVTPIVKQFNLPLSDRGQLIVNDHYEVAESPGIYAIGDCAQIKDPITNEYDGMTCKEAIPQSQRLAKILKNKMTHSSNQVIHKSIPYRLFCISLGPHEGFVWIQKWGLNFTITGQLGMRFRQFTWDIASLVK
ncbi:FAD-dependent oxidoreductase [Bacillus spongiae]|uniref:FAD-dependent oxidoreductase n=1 Tax=Bacillus spongiae TaxID=2683610 RepID=A0ABU8HJ35_9BACI